jgi:probable DNA metabolism protein
MSDEPYPNYSWAYDGSLEALFILVDRALRDCICPTGPYGVGAGPPSLFDAPQPDTRTFSETAADEAARRLRAIPCLLFDLSLRVWMSEEEVVPELLELAAEIGRKGPDVAEDYARPKVRRLRTACKRVDREIQRLEGLARFSPAGHGLYSAPLEPDHNVIAALVPHFSRRFGPQAFALVDLRRSIAFESRDGELRAHEGKGVVALLPDASEDEDVELWRRYYQATENPARRNPALQRRLMPSRYWKFLPELTREQARGQTR